MHYWVVTVSRFGNEERITGDIYATPLQADRNARYRQGIVSSESMYRYGVRPATWREREAAMFTEGVYSPPVWAEELFWRNAPLLHRAHFTHISLADPTMIAFTESEEKGERDLQKPMRPGKYLQKFLGAGRDGTIEDGPYKGEPPRITKMQIAFYAQWHQHGHRPPSDDVLEFAETEERMVEVYEEGPDSCMMGKGWPFERHPVRVYAGGGLALAVLLSSSSGEVIGRALCWPAKEVFGRVYPTPNGETSQNRYDELMARLKAKGWTSITEKNSVFEGALLRKIEGRYGGYLMPYLDNDYGVEDAKGPDGTWDWWRMTHHAHHQDNTDGTYNAGEPEYDYHCECCEEGLYEDDCYTVYRGWRQGARQGHGYPTGERTYCAGCRDYNAFYCEGSDEYYTCEDDRIDTRSGGTYVRSYFEANGGWQCSFSDEYFLRDEDEPVVLADGSLIHPDELDTGAFRCLWSGLLWPIDDQSTRVPGYCAGYDFDPVHPIEFEHRLPDIPPDEALANSLAMGFEAPPPETFEPQQASLFVAIDLAKSGLRYDPACIRQPVLTDAHSSSL